MKLSRILSLWMALVLLAACGQAPAPETTTATSRVTEPPASETTAATTAETTVETTAETMAETATETTTEVPAETSAPVDAGAILIIGDRAMEHYYGVASALKKYAATVGKIQAVLPQVRVFAVFCPTAIEFTAPEEYQKGSRSQKQAAETAYAALPETVVPVDVWSALSAHRDEYLYFRTDHHWTQRGAYYAYTAFAKAAGFAPYALSEYETGTTEGFVGSMIGFLGSHPGVKALKENPDTVEYFLPKTAAKAQYFASGALTNGVSIPIVSKAGDNYAAGAKYGIFLSGDQPVIRIQNETVKNGKKLLVTKESYGNALIPFLTDHYEEVYVVDPRQFNASGKPSLSLTAKAQEWGITDIACVNYAFSASGGFVNQMAALFPAP